MLDKKRQKWRKAQGRRSHDAPPASALNTPSRTRPLTKNPSNNWEQWKTVENERTNERTLRTNNAPTHHLRTGHRRTARASVTLSPLCTQIADREPNRELSRMQPLLLYLSYNYQIPLCYVYTLASGSNGERKFLLIAEGLRVFFFFVNPACDTFRSTEKILCQRTFSASSSYTSPGPQARVQNYSY